MEEKRMISKERGEKVAEENGIKFYETSAKDNVNIEHAFITVNNFNSTNLNVYFKSTKQKTDFIFFSWPRIFLISKALPMERQILVKLQ